MSKNKSFAPKKAEERKPIMSVTLSDCEVQTFRAGGKGGQNQNKRDTGVRIVHRPSGAIGESREERSQLQNKKTAFNRMVESGKFRAWIMRVTSTESPEDYVSSQMRPWNLLIEGRSSDGWVKIE